MTLHEIGVKHKTDKATHHHYLSLYELLFQGFQAPRILEIGVQFGNSLRTWREYFPGSKIIGIDSIDNGEKGKADGTVILIGDAYCEEMVKSLGDGLFDIMIDDGSHNLKDQQYFVEHYAKLLNNRGILIVEDVLKKEYSVCIEQFLSDRFHCTTVEMTDGNSIVDSRLFIAWRK